MQATLGEGKEAALTLYQDGSGRWERGLLEEAAYAMGAFVDRTLFDKQM